LTPRPSVRYEHSVPDPKSENRAPSGTGTGARWAASLWNTPLAAQWADSRTAWREGIREAVTLPLMKRIFKIDFRRYSELT